MGKRETCNVQREKNHLGLTWAYDESDEVCKGREENGAARVAHGLAQALVHRPQGVRPVHRIHQHNSVVHADAHLRTNNNGRGRAAHGLRVVVVRIRNAASPRARRTTFTPKKHGLPHRDEDEHEGYVRERHTEPARQPEAHGL